MISFAKPKKKKDMTNLKKTTGKNFKMTPSSH